MKTTYRHIHFVAVYEGLNPKIKKWSCRNNKSKEEIGNIDFYATWKRFVFKGREGCVFDVGCLRDIIDFISQL